MTFAFALVRLLSVALLGIFAGAMLTEGGVLVPYWRSLAPADFLAWYGGNDRRLLGFFGPLTSATALLAVVVALASFWAGHDGRWLALLAAALTLIVVATFFLYFEKANLSFATGSVGVDRVAGELARWASWHWWRTGLSLVAFGAGLLSLARLP